MRKFLSLEEDGSFKFVNITVRRLLTIYWKMKTNSKVVQSLERSYSGSSHWNLWECGVRVFVEAYR